MTLTPGQKLIAAYHGGEIGDFPELARAIDAAIEAASTPKGKESRWGFYISPMELVALRKLALVSKALAEKLNGRARDEQDCLATCLVDVLDRYEISASAIRSRSKPQGE